jgi:hypothetical protein
MSLAATAVVATTSVFSLFPKTKKQPAFIEPPRPGIHALGGTLPSHRHDVIQHCAHVVSLSSIHVDRDRLVDSSEKIRPGPIQRFFPSRHTSPSGR